jgi:hypothetical protein
LPLLASFHYVHATPLHPRSPSRCCPRRSRKTRLRLPAPLTRSDAADSGNADAVSHNQPRQRRKFIRLRLNNGPAVKCQRGASSSACVDCQGLRDDQKQFNCQLKTSPGVCFYCGG